jgi:hypothetical protein
MIHYMTADGLSAPWVGNELRIVGEAGVPYALHTMRAPTKTNFGSAWAQAIAQGMRRPLYPLPVIELVRSVVAGPFVWGSVLCGAVQRGVWASRDASLACGLPCALLCGVHVGDAAAEGKQGESHPCAVGV